MADRTSRSKVLIVDDTPESIHLLLETLRDEYAVIVATDGKKALDLAAKEPVPDLILLDVRMPGLDGFEVCRLLKEDSRLCDIPVIFLSLLGDTEDKVRALRSGGVDYITKPFNFEEVRARVRTHLKLREAQRELQRKGAELQEAYNQLERELRCVGEVQESLLPARLCDIPGFRSCAYYHPARRAGGDYYTIVPIDDERWGVLIADVSGHGPPAAVVTAMTHVMLRLAPAKGNPDQVLTFMNDALCGSTRPEQFVTAFYGVFEPASRTLTYSSAGHPPPLVYRANSKDFFYCDVIDGIPLGIETSGIFPAASLRYSPGDLFVFYTDGITEAESAEGVMFGIEGLQNIIKGSDGVGPDVLVKTLCENMKSFTGRSDQNDDITLLVLANAS